MTDTEAQTRAAPFLDTVREVIRLARERDAEDRAWSLAHPTWAEKVGATLDHASNCPARHALRRYLRALDGSTLRKIYALMYAGRGDGDLAPEFIVYLREVEPTPEDVARAVASKAPLARYLEAGIAYAASVGVDLSTWQPEAATEGRQSR